ncbi:hypothetical protein [Dokdonella fugitiva]|uniref:hypothetical protein n=1 Tax=Dokdonella fugitiva TaxID=328517 RepID=UPI0015F8CDDE|nr:hypothetical protein [Dokdonella fugitiva]MBA8885268.1 hypothetical protein [Dokdonella fugitiva]
MTLHRSVWIGATNTPALPTQGQPAANGLKTTLLEGIIVTPTFEDDFAEWQRRDAIEFVSTPFVAGLGFLTGTNPWRVNAPGDDSMEPATIPVPVVTGLKATAVGFAILRNASRLEEGYGVLSGIPESALRGWKVGDPIENLTKAGNSPAWSTVRARYWKNVANEALDGEYNVVNIARMRAGKPPLHELGVPWS